MRLVMLAPFGMRPKGTLAVRMLPLAQELVRRGVSVRIIAPSLLNPQDAGRHDIYEGVSVLHTHQSQLSGPAGLFQQVIMLLQHTWAFQPDLIHVFKPKGYSGLAALLSRFLLPHRPLVVDTDDWEGWGGWNDLLPYPRLAKHFFAWQERDLPRRADAVTVASRTLETQVWGFGVDPRRVFYLPNGVVASSKAAHEPDRPDTQARPYTALLYTRFWELDVHEVVITLVGIAAQRSDVRLLVIGKGERGEEQNLLHLARQAGVASLIDYCGWLEPEHIPQLMASADLALVPMNDTLINRARCSVKLLELMGTGLPVIATRVGQVQEYIEHERTGLLVAPGNPGALAQAVLRLLEDALLRQRLGAAARMAVEDFSWDRIAVIVERAYQSAQQHKQGFAY